MANDSTASSTGMPTLNIPERSNLTRSRSAEWLATRKIDLLPGINKATKAALVELEITTVFDLATSRHFALAEAIARGALDDVRVLNDVLVKQAQGKPLAEMRKLGIESIRGIGPAGADVFRKAGIKNIIELAQLEARNVAKQIVYGLNLTEEPDGDLLYKFDQAGKIVPYKKASRKLATEKRYYDVVALAPLDAKTGDLLDLQESQGLDLNDVAAGTFDSTGIYHGLIMTYEQTWHPQALTPGTLLRSVGLAPGEKVNIATVDWSRRDLVGLTEDTEQRESLSNELVRDRHIEEVSKAVAREAQNAFSTSRNQTAIDSFGASAGGSLGIGATASDGEATGAGGLGIGMGGQANATRTDSTITGFITASGDKNVAVETAQDINDATQQVASSVRSRYASTLLEVQQGENERITTRVLRNYNRRHTLNIHYFEAVQVYETKLSVKKYNMALMIPLKTIDTWSDELILHFWEQITALALDPKVAEIVPRIADTVRVSPFHSGQFGALPNMFQAQKLAADFATGTDVAPGSDEIWNLPKNTKVLGVHVDVGATNTVANDAIFSLSGGEGMNFLGSLVIEKADSGGEMTSQPFQYKLDWDLRAENLTIEDISALRVMVNHNERVPDDDSADEVDHPFVEQNYYLFRVVVDFQVGQNPFSYIKSISRNQLPTGSSAGSSEELFEFSTEHDTSDIEWLRYHLTRHKYHYSRGIWLTMDRGQLFAILSNYRLNGTRITSVVDAIPYGFVGSHVILKGPGVDPANMIQIRGQAAGYPAIGEVIQSDLVPLATGGVISEGVLGSSVAAETIDHRYFWNWQDSPIPDDAPLIAPVQAGSRAQQHSITTGDLESSVIKIQEPPRQPEPTGVAAAYNAVTSPTMLESLSALSSLSDIATAGLNAAAQVTNQTGQQASTNLGNAMRLAADVAATAAQASKPSFGELNTTEFGGLLNAAGQVGASSQSPSTQPQGSNTGPAATNASSVGPAEVVKAALGITDLTPLVDLPASLGSNGLAAAPAPGQASAWSADRPKSEAQKQANASAQKIIDDAEERGGVIDQQATDEFRQMLLTWYSDSVRPLALLAKTDDSQIANAYQEYLEWHTAAQQTGLDSDGTVGSSRGEVMGILSDALRRAVTLVGSRIAATGNADYLYDLIRWAEMAMHDWDTPPFADLDEALVLAGGTLHIEEILLPNLAVGESAEISVKARLVFQGVPIDSQPVQVKVTAGNANVDPAEFTPLPGSTAHVTLSRTGNADMTLKVNAIWSWGSVLTLEAERLAS